MQRQKRSRHRHSSHLSVFYVLRIACKTVSTQLADKWMSCCRCYKSCPVVFNFVLPGVLHDDEQREKNTKEYGFDSKNKCPCLANCLAAQVNANFVPSTCVRWSKVAAVVTLSEPKSSRYSLTRLRWGNHIASDTYNHLLFSVNMEIWSHWRTGDIWRLPGNSIVVKVPWFQISNSRLLLLEIGRVTAPFPLFLIHNNPRCSGEVVLRSVFT